MRGTGINRRRVSSGLCAAAHLGLLLGLVLAGCSGPTSDPEASRPPVEVSAGLDRAVATLGDRITWTLTVDRAAEVEVDVPPLGGDLDGLTVVDAGHREKTRANRVVEEHWVRLRVDEVGSLELPAITVSYRQTAQPKGAESGQAESGEAESGEAESGEVASTEEEPVIEATVETSPLTLEVESMLERAGAEVTDIRGLKPLAEPATPLLWIWILGGAALLALATFAVLWLRRRRRTKPEAPPRPPHEVVLERISALADLDLSDPQAVRRFHFEISEALRAYIEARFGLNATDLTTEEIVVALPSVRGLTAEPAKSLRRFLLATDRVKFADHRPSEGEIQEVLERARSFVEATVPPPSEEEDRECDTRWDSQTPIRDPQAEGTSNREEAA